MQVQRSRAVTMGALSQFEKMIFIYFLYGLSHVVEVTLNSGIIYSYYDKVFLIVGRILHLCIFAYN